MDKLHASSGVERLLNGNYYNKLVDYVRHGVETVEVRPEDVELLERIDRTKELLLHHKNDRAVVALIKDEFNIGEAQAYRYVHDTKMLWAQFQSFNPIVELMLMKERIDWAFQKAEDHPDKFQKLIGSALQAQERWFLLMREEQERLKPDEPKKFIFNYHMDWSKIPGLDAEKFEQWNKMFDDFESSSRSRVKKHIDAEDVFYETSND